MDDDSSRNCRLHRLINQLNQPRDYGSSLIAGFLLFFAPFLCFFPHSIISSNLLVYFFFRSLAFCFRSLYFLFLSLSLFSLIYIYRILI
ncbi:hypothetical protein BDV23DRAFT_117863 [Aspergillus alliaceus]|uniref:Uncharacterized protein n=1 Tax=Petromyces alliaceus TaxID=209559 RepID=A0A5N7C214_PETAA|nr:hypothetical protein BDV23DRAFT_117863 [Aspergillus alliaceus]